jgi:hypothetical protein
MQYIVHMESTSDSFSSGVIKLLAGMETTNAALPVLVTLTFPNRY